jgi:hypothetical protein
MDVEPRQLRPVSHATPSTLSVEKNTVRRFFHLVIPMAWICAIEDAPFKRNGYRLPAIVTSVSAQLFAKSAPPEVAPAIVNVGAIRVVLPMIDAAAVLDLQPDLAKLAAFERRLGVTGLTVFGRYPHGELAMEVRTFAPSCGVEEDPVCGSGNASVAAFKWERGL